MNKADNRPQTKLKWSDKDKPVYDWMQKVEHDYGITNPTLIKMSVKKLKELHENGIIRL